MPSMRYSSPCKNSSSVGIMYTTANAKARPTSPVFTEARNTDKGWLSASSSRMRGCSTMFQ